jgi:arylsulfatase A-like enzyme
MQGRSFRSNLAGKTPKDWPDAMYYRYWMHVKYPLAPAGVPGHYGIRTKRYKLIFKYGLALGMKGATEEWKEPASMELYDLKKDPLEMNNVYDDPKYARVAGQLKKKLLKLKTQLGDEDHKYPEMMAVREKGRWFE